MQSPAMFALMQALRGAGILQEHHLMIWTPIPIPTRGTATPGFLLQLADKRDGTLTRFTLCGVPVPDADPPAIHLQGLFGVEDADTAAYKVALAVDLGAILPRDGQVESPVPNKSPEPE